MPELVRYKRRHPSCRMIMDIHMDYSNSGKSFVALRILHGAIRRFFLDWARPHLDRIYPVVPVRFPFMREIYGVPDSEMELRSEERRVGKECGRKGRFRGWPSHKKK